ncbi:Snl1p [Lachancea thermotolerans CBS 6340]|uniref:KLTH0E04840p n=1 Tax=Lachancea thermotolerans (strain ATCC 56472 / CBS 6340 / NRRL Y-8284) TaxID=559295 RepID=C5DHJ6_LACTC|nr:KLTH0E04840p [Lachancea thermotolerans CBS 6340]CAR23257.1 KLTH0E04840p [Lachancea thermotolerans CBS 6340]
MDMVRSWLQSPTVKPTKDYVTSSLEPWVRKLRNDNMAMIYTATAVGALLLVLVFKPSKSSKPKKSHKSKGKKAKNPERSVQRKPLTLEEQIEGVHQKFVNEYKEGLDRLAKNYDAKSEKDQYQLNYYNEMLLKLVIELDGVDLVEVEPELKAKLKSRRKQVIHEIQSNLKKLDQLKRQ